jgi:fructose-1,6-bisphosphatase I
MFSGVILSGVYMNKHTTLTQFIINQQRNIPHATSDFTALLNEIAVACKQIAHAVHKGALSGTLGSANSENVQGETQKQLDVITNDIMVEALNWTGHLSGMVSEEVYDVITIPAEYPKGKYLALFDPLDGSSNIDVNLTVGTIFSILRGNAGQDACEADFLQQGIEQVCAGFVLYGPATILVLTTGQGVNGFTLDHDMGEFVLTHENMTVPVQTTEFAINMSNQRFWEAPVQRYIQECLEGEAGVRGKSFNMRWVASMVAEAYRILTRGGIFLYPLDVRQADKPGKLRLMYEANPIGFIIEQAGGLCSTGRQRMLEVIPEGIHQRVPVILGSKEEVERVVSYHQ